MSVDSDHSSFTQSPAHQFRELLKQSQPLKVVGAINAYCAMMAERIGHQALYLSGAGVANACYGLPDLGMTSRDNVIEEARRITGASALPLLVDIDTGWGDALGIARTISECERAQIGAVHIEDQCLAKRCGHRQGKQLVSARQMAERIDACVQARQRDIFVFARTDSRAGEGLAGAIERAQMYVQAGADGIFAEALLSLAEYQEFCRAVPVPVLANLTEFGQTPLMSCDDLAEVGVAVALYPLTAFRAMNQAAQAVYSELLERDDQSRLLEHLQTREQLYEYLNYLDQERAQAQAQLSSSPLNLTGD